MTLIGDILNSWEQFGLFSIILPFILAFAILFGILEKIKLFDKRSTHVTLALVFSLTATALSYYNDCLSIFVIANVMALTGVLVFYVLIGFVVEKPEKVSYLAWIVAMIIFYIVFTVRRECRIPNLGMIVTVAAAAPALANIIKKTPKTPPKPPKKDLPHGPTPPTPSGQHTPKKIIDRPRTPNELLNPSGQATPSGQNTPSGQPSP